MTISLGQALSSGIIKTLAAAYTAQNSKDSNVLTNLYERLFVLQKNANPLKDTISMGTELKALEDNRINYPSQANTMTNFLVKVVFDRCKADIANIADVNKTNSESGNKRRYLLAALQALFPEIALYKGAGKPSAEVASGNDYNQGGDIEKSRTQASLLFFTYVMSGDYAALENSIKDKATFNTLRDLFYDHIKTAQDYNSFATTMGIHDLGKIEAIFKPVIAKMGKDTNDHDAILSFALNDPELIKDLGLTSFNALPDSEKDMIRAGWATEFLGMQALQGENNAYTWVKAMTLYRDNKRAFMHFYLHDIADLAGAASGKSSFINPNQPVNFPPVSADTLKAFFNVKDSIADSLDKGKDALHAYQSYLEYRASKDRLNETEADKPTLYAKMRLAAMLRIYVPTESSMASSNPDIKANQKNDYALLGDAINKVKGEFPNSYQTLITELNRHGMDDTTGIFAYYAPSVFQNLKGAPFFMNAPDSSDDPSNQDTRTYYLAYLIKTVADILQATRDHIVSKGIKGKGNFTVNMSDFGIKYNANFPSSPTERQANFKKLIDGSANRWKLEALEGNKQEVNVIVDLSY